MSMVPRPFGESTHPWTSIVPVAFIASRFVSVSAEIAVADSKCLSHLQRQPTTYINDKNAYSGGWVSHYHILHSHRGVVDPYYYESCWVICSGVSLSEAVVSDTQPYMPLREFPKPSYLNRDPESALKNLYHFSSNHQNFRPVVTVTEELNGPQGKKDGSSPDTEMALYHMLRLT